MFVFLNGVASLSYGQAVRKYSNEFLKIGVGAKGIGMGNAVTASVNDITAGYYNPAGLTQIESNFDIGYMHAEYFAGIAKYDYGAIAIPMKAKKQVLAFSFIRLGVDDIPNTINLVNIDGTIDYNKVTLFNVADFALLTSFAKKMGTEDRLSLGGTAKIVYRNYGTFSNSWGFGIDLGAQYKVKNWRFGCMIQDITTTFNAWSFSFTDQEKEVFKRTGNDIPSSALELTAPTIKLGASYKYELKDKFSVEPSLDFIAHTDGRRNVLIRTSPLSFDMALGVELGLWKVFYLRSGIYNIQQATNDTGKTYTSVQPNLGAGLKFKWFNLDYTYTNLGSTESSGVGLYSHVASLVIHLYRKETPVK